VGPTENPKVGFDWSPIDDLKIRGSAGTSFKAPLPQQLYNAPNNGGPQFIVDNGSSTGTVNAIVYSGGNSALTPEKATTYSLGGDYTPSFLPGFLFTDNFFYYDFYNKIGQVAGAAGAQILATASSRALYSNYYNCLPALGGTLTVAQVQHEIAINPGIANAGIDPTQVQCLVDGRSNNIGISQAKGMDVKAQYNFDTDWGHFGIQEGLTYYFQYLNAVVTGAPAIENVNQINYPLSYKSLTRLAWANDDGLSVTGILTHIPAYQNNQVAPIQIVSSYNQFDFQIAYDTGEVPSWYLTNWRVSFNVQDLFNSSPPFVNNVNGYGYDPQVVSPDGRIFSISLVKKFN